MTKIKICGLTRIEDIYFVNEAKPDYVGFVFAKSKRQIDLEQAVLLSSMLAKEIKSVGVFVNEDIEYIKKLCCKNVIGLVQLHGGESEKYIEEIKKATGKPVIKAFRIRHRGDISYTTADYSLLDSYHQGQYGGTGNYFDWELVKGYEQPFFLAGGLNIDNIKSALENIKPYCLDVSSGVETDGKKDKTKIINIVNIVRSRS